MTMTTDTSSDAELIERLRAHDLEALGSLFDRYYAQVFRTAAAITRDSDAADDIAQDAFLRLHRYVARIDTQLPLAAWLYRVTVNLSYTYINRKQKRRISLEGLVEQLRSPQSSAPDHAAEQSETHQRIRQAISVLPFNQRVVVVLHYLNGLSLEEIADILNCPLGTVKSRLFYARDNLRHQFDQSFDFSDLAHGYAGLA